MKGKYPKGKCLKETKFIDKMAQSYYSWFGAKKMSEFTNILATKQKELLKMITPPPVRRQNCPQPLEDNGSEDKNI